MIASLAVDVSQLKTATEEMKLFAQKAEKHMSSVNTGLRKTAKETGTVGKSFTNFLDHVGGQMYTFGIRWSMYITAPIILTGTKIMRVTAEFEDSMNKIMGLVGESRGQIDRWSKSILKIAPSLGQTPKKMADALYFITSSGISGAEAMDVLNKSAMAATAGLGDLKQIADLVTTALNAYSGTGLDASRVLDVLTAAVKEGKAEAGDFARQMGQVLPIAAQMGVSFTEVAASMASMSLGGINASHSAVYLKGILNSLLSPSDQVNTALSDIGLTAKEVTTVMRNDLFRALQMIQSGIDTWGESLAGELFPNIRALTGFSSLMGKNLEKNIEVFREVYASTGDMAYAFEMASDKIKYKWDQAMSGAQVTMIEVGEVLRERIVPAIETFTKIVRRIGEVFVGLPSILQNFIMKAVFLAAVIGPISLGLSFLSKMVLPLVIQSFVLFGSALKGVISLINKGTISMAAFNTVIKANPLVAVLSVITSLVALLPIFSGRTKYLTDKQKEFNDELERSLKLQKQQIPAIEDYMKIVNSLSKNELQNLLMRVNEQLKTLESEKALLDISRKKGQIPKYRMEGASLLMYGKITVAEYRKILEGGHAAEDRYFSDSIKKYTEWADIINKILSGFKEPFKSIVPEVEEEVKASIASIERMSAVLSSVGIAYDIAREKQQVYSAALDKLSTEKSTMATEAMYKYARILGSIPNKSDYAKKSIGELAKMFTELQKKLNFAEAMRALRQFSELEYLTEQYNAFKGAMRELAGIIPSGIAGWINYGAAIAYVTENMKKLDKSMGFQKMRYELKQFNDESRALKDIEKSLGSQFDLNSAMVSHYREEIIRLSREGYKENKARIDALIPTMNEYALLLRKEQLQMELLQIAVQGMVSASQGLGRAIAGEQSGWVSLGEAVYSAVQQMITALIMVSAAQIMQDETRKKGIIGVLVGAAGVALLTATWTGIKNSVENSAKMAKGGVVPAGYPNDTYPARLTSGETVLPPGELPDTKRPIVLHGEWVRKGYDTYFQVKEYEKHRARTG